MLVGALPEARLRNDRLLDDWPPGAAPDAGFSVRRAIGDPADVQDPAQILLTGLYRFGRVIRVKDADLVAHLERARIAPGSLRHLYPEPLRPEENGPTGSP